MRVPRSVAPLAAAVLLASSFGALADHPQASSGRSAAFDHVTGNEWWVEARLSGADAGSVASVEAQDTNGPWTALAKKSWGPYAASFHIEPGNQVRFRATWSGGAQLVSCWFTHPAGAEQCGSTGTTTTTASTTSTTGGGGFDAEFTGFRGNEWWVQANVGTDGPAISKVDVRIAPDGAWKPLAKQSWGATAWAASFHFPQGSILQMRATATDGQTDLSSCRQWIPPSGQDAAIVACPGGSSTGTTTVVTDPPCAFDPAACTSTSTSTSATSTSTGGAGASFTGVRGNEWWIQASVASPKGVSKVDATLDGGATHKALAKQSWGGWAASFRIVQGSTVQLRATLGDGSVAHSLCHGWIPPTSQTDAAVVACPGAGTGTTSSSASTTTAATSSSTTGTTAPRVTWSTRTVGEIDGFHGPVVARDFDLDGDGDVVVLGSEGTHLLRPTGPVLLDSSMWWQGESGPGADGYPSLYVVGFPSGQESMELRELRIAGDQVVSARPVYGSLDPIGPFHFADLDGWDSDGRQEIYVARGVATPDGLGFAAVIDRVDPIDPSTPPRQVADLGDAGRGFLAIMALETIDVPGGAPTLLALAATFDEQDRMENRVYALRPTDGGAMRADVIATFLDEPSLFDVGDVDRDGRPDLVTGNSTHFLVLRAWPSSWSQDWGNPVPAGMLDGAFQDADGDGYSDLYVGADDGRLYQVVPHHAGGFVAKAIATVATGDDMMGPVHVAIGEGDTDSLMEIHSVVFTLRDDGSVTTRIVETGFGPDTTGFDATFTGVQGNEWWVQVRVSANHPLAGVEVRVDCMSWRPLALQSWGGWAASYHIPAGSRVEFRALSDRGGAEVSGAYAWPQATPTEPCYP